MNKRLLLITPDFPPNTGGVARYLSNLCLFLGSNIRVITPSEESLSFRYVWPKWLKVVWICFRERKTYDYLITSHVVPIGTAMLISFFITKKPFVVIVHGMDVRLCEKSFWKRFLLKCILFKSHRVITNTKSLKSELLNRYDISHTTVIYPCIDFVDCIQEEHYPLRLLTVGRLVKRKGHIRVLEAIAKLKNENRLPLCEYRIIGSGSMENEIKSKIISLKLSDIVVMCGEVTDDELNKSYSISDVFVMPVIDDKVDKEGFGMVFLESALHKIPSISTNISGIDEAIIHEQTGLLLNNGDQISLENAIIRLLTNKEDRLRMGNNAHDRVISEFGYKHQFGKLNDVFV